MARSYARHGRPTFRKWLAALQHEWRPARLAALRGDRHDRGRTAHVRLREKGDSVVKWRLMLTTLPYVGAVLAAKLFLQFVLGFHGFVDFSDVGIVLTAGVFLLGFLLAGTMADYKEAEKIPAELAATLETIEEIFVLAATSRPGLDVGRLRGGVLDLTVAIKDWLLGRHPSATVYGCMTGLNGLIQQLEREGAGPYASRAVPQLLAVRRNVARIDVIRRTGFLPPAYALLEVLITMIIALVLIARFKSLAAEVLLVPFVALINIYMLRLIRDIDDPFDYDVDGREHGSGEVMLFPLDEYRARLAERTGPVRAATSGS
jgi:hypothetical protein